MGLALTQGLISAAASLLKCAQIQVLLISRSCVQDLGALNLGDISLQEFGTETDVLIRVQSQNLEDSEALSEADKAAIALVSNTLGDGYEIRRTEYVGAVVGSELRQKAMWAIIAALGAIMAVCIRLRFEWPFAISAIVALGHDIISTVGLFSLTGFEFNLATVAALLTIAGYSINDTVVVFDRVRQPAITNLTKSLIF